MRLSHRHLIDAARPPRRPGSCGLFVVCDGHNGVTAARYVADQLPAYLDDLLPPGEMPGDDDPKGYTKWRQGLQRALTVSLALMHRAFAGLGVLAGCTVTIVLQVGLCFAFAPSQPASSASRGAAGWCESEKQCRCCAARQAAIRVGSAP